MTSFHERLAAAATPGPWSAREDHGGLWDVVSPDDDTYHLCMSVSPADAALVAACQPEMVQAWENVVKAAREVALYEGNRFAYERAQSFHEALAVYDAQVDALQEEAEAALRDSETKLAEAEEFIRSEGLEHVWRGTRQVPDA